MTTIDTDTPYGPKLNTNELDEFTLPIVNSIKNPNALNEAMIEGKTALYGDVTNQLKAMAKNTAPNIQKQQEHLDAILQGPEQTESEPEPKTKDEWAKYNFKKNKEKQERKQAYEIQKAIYDKINKTGGKYSKRKYSRIKRKRVTRKGMRKTRSKSKKNYRKNSKKHYKRH